MKICGDERAMEQEKKTNQRGTSPTHTHTYIYLYINLFVCTCVGQVRYILGLCLWKRERDIIASRATVFPAGCRERKKTQWTTTHPVRD